MKAHEGQGSSGLAPLEWARRGHGGGEPRRAKARLGWTGPGAPDGEPVGRRIHEVPD